QLVGHGGFAVHIFSSFSVTVRPLPPATSQVTDTSSQASAVRPLTLPIADAIAPGSSDAIVAGVVATGVPVCVGGQVLSSSKMLSVIAQFARATPPVSVTWNVIWLTPFASCVAHCFSIATLGTPHTSLSVAVIFFGCDGFAGSTDPTTSHVTETVLQAFFVSPLTLPFTVVIIPCGSDATPGTATGFDVVVVGGQVGSFGNTLSVTVQLKSAVPPVFWAMYCTVSGSAATLVPSTVKAFQPRHDCVPPSLFDSKPTSMNGPAPHLICLSTFTLQVSHVSCAVAVSVF